MRDKRSLSRREWLRGGLAATGASLLHPSVFGFVLPALETGETVVPFLDPQPVNPDRAHGSVGSTRILDHTRIGLLQRQTLRDPGSGHGEMEAVHRRIREPAPFVDSGGFEGPSQESLHRHSRVLRKRRLGKIHGGHRQCPLERNPAGSGPGGMRSEPGGHRGGLLRSGTAARKKSAAMSTNRISGAVFRSGKPFGIGSFWPTR